MYSLIFYVQANILALNSQCYLKNGGNFVMAIKATTGGSLMPTVSGLGSVRSKLAENDLVVEQMYPLGLYQLAYSVVVGVFRPTQGERGCGNSNQTFIPPGMRYHDSYLALRYIVLVLDSSAIFFCRYFCSCRRFSGFCSYCGQQ